MMPKDTMPIELKLGIAIGATIAILVLGYLFFTGAMVPMNLSAPG